MDQKALVTIYTQVYNTKPYLEKCITSVLSQTYKYFEYILVDNGCTDGSSEIIEAFAKKDSRIKPIRFSENQRRPRLKITRECATGVYYTVIDSDDWWESDYLERMISFLEKNDLDLAVTGTFSYLEEQGIGRVLRKLDQPILLTQKEFAQHYRYFWAYPNTTWASLQKMDLWKKGDFARVPLVPYGGDTMHMLEYIKLCDRIGIDNSALYHYRIHPNSVSYQYNPQRFEANVALYEKMREFLEPHHALTTENTEWLKRFHLASMGETLALLYNARIPLEQKLNECLRILKHPLTKTALTCSCDERDQWYAVMWNILSVGIAKTNSSPSEREMLAEALSLLSPSCGGAFGPEEIGLLGRDPALLEAARADDATQLSNLLLNLIAKKQFSKQYDLGAILHRLIPQSSPLRNMADTRFFRTYAPDCAEILAGDQITALDHMTRLLLEGKIPYAQEQFLDIYLSLAALENQAAAFVFGKLQLAKLYLDEGRREDCRAAAQELAEMGLDNEEFLALCRELEAQP